MPTTNGNESVRVALIGGGIGGLCLAIGLLQHPQIQFHIYEAAPQFSEIGAGVAIAANAQRTFSLIDPRLREAFDRVKTSNIDDDAVDDHRRRTRDTYIFHLGMDHRNGVAKAGDTICKMVGSDGIGTVHRAHFLEQLVALLPEEVKRDRVSFGHRLVSIDVNDTNEDHNADDTNNQNLGRKAQPSQNGEDDGAGARVTLRFDNGAIAHVDAVIGCDGIKSVVRKTLLGPETPAAHPVYAGLYAYRGLIPMSKAAAAIGDRLARNARQYLGYNGHVLTFPIESGKTMNVIAVRSNDAWLPEGSEWIVPTSREAMLRDFSEWGPDVKKIMQLLDNPSTWALFHHLPAKSYHDERGRMVLMGDAAHATTPFHGAGAGMAIEDAYILSGILGEVKQANQLRCAFETFDRVRRQRTQRLVRSSHEQVALYEFRLPGIGDDLDKIAEVLPTRSDWIYDHDIEAEMDETRKMLRNTLKSKL
jgi:salicylate hydroxylase